jgi:hypothetical protein
MFDIVFPRLAFLAAVGSFGELIGFYDKSTPLAGEWKF